MERTGTEASAPTADEIDLASAGDEAAIESVVRWAWPQVHRVAYMLTHDGSASEDIAQEAVIAAVRSLGSFDRSREPGPWLERIAANKSIDWMRRRQRRREVELADETIDEDPGLVHELAATVDEAISADVMDALDSLTPDQRQAVVLRHLLDYEPVEIAAMLDLPAPTVRTHIHRGLLRLRERLERDERRTA